MMLFLLEWGLASFLALVAATQVIVPLLRGVPIFPALQRHGIEAKLATVKQDLRLSEVELEIDKLKTRVERNRQRWTE